MLLAVGTSVGFWLVGRILQGVSAGMLWVVCLALLTDTVGPAGMGKAIGVIGIPMSIGPVMGPLLGGVIYAHGGYFAVFGLMFAMLGVDAVLRLAMIEHRVAKKWLEAEAVDPEKVDVGPKSDTSATSTPSSESASITHATTENCAEAAHDAAPSGRALYYRFPPILRLLLSFRMLVAVAGGVLQSSLNVAFDSTLPLTVNVLFGWEQTGQGLIFITILIPSLLQPLFGAIIDKYQHSRRLLAAGACLLATPAYVLLRLVTRNTLAQKALLCALLVIIGLAMAVAMLAIVAEIGATVAEAETNDPQAIKKSVTATGWSFAGVAGAAGTLVGPLFAGLIRNAAGWQTTTWCLGLLSAFTGVFLLLCLGGWIGKLVSKGSMARVSQ